MASVRSVGLPAARPARRRGAALEQAVYEAVFLELGEVGYAGLTMERIARRAGTGKAPLYRRWPTKQDLILHALEHLPSPETRSEVDTGELRGDLVGLLAAQAFAMAQPTGRGIYRLLLELIPGQDHHRDLIATILAAIEQPRLAAITEALRRAALRGEISPRAISDLIIRTGPALVLHHQLRHDTARGRDDITDLVDVILIPALNAASAPSNSTPPAQLNSGNPR